MRRITPSEADIAAGRSRLCPKCVHAGGAPPQKPNGANGDQTGDLLPQSGRPSGAS
jgi:hypothetical protein